MHEQLEGGYRTSSYKPGEGYTLTKFFGWRGGDTTRNSRSAVNKDENKKDNKRKADDKDKEKEKEKEKEWSCNI